MELSSNPVTGGQRLQCGDYAVSQNQNDRSHESLNLSMDNSFNPLHQEYCALWAEQRRTESRVSECAGKRDEADKALDLRCKGVLDALAR